MEESQRDWKCILNTRKLHWISERDDEHQQLLQKRKKMDKLDENWEAANWARTTDGQGQVARSCVQ